VHAFVLDAWIASNVVLDSRVELLHLGANDPALLLALLDQHERWQILHSELLYNILRQLITIRTAPKCEMIHRWVNQWAVIYTLNLSKSSRQNTASSFLATPILKYGRSMTLLAWFQSAQNISTTFQREERKREINLYKLELQKCIP